MFLDTKLIFSPHKKCDGFFYDSNSNLFINPTITAIITQRSNFYRAQNLKYIDTSLNILFYCERLKINEKDTLNRITSKPNPFN